MKFDPDEIKRLAAQDFDKTWNLGKEIVPAPAINESYPRLRFDYGQTHPIFETAHLLREAYLRMGFCETMNPVIVEDREVYRQFGSEALAVLDRCFYLAGLPRPDIGLSDDRIAKVGEIIGRELAEEDAVSVKEVLHAYKKGEIEGDDLIPVLAKRLGAADSKVARVIDEVFPEFRELTPEPTKKTLRSHMTSGWFMTLSALVLKRDIPLKLFSVDRCFRREQSEDASRLMTYHSASCVVAGVDVTVEYGKAISKALLSQFGFEKFRFQPDEKRSKYYVPDTQIEVYAYHPALRDSDSGTKTKYADGWIEIATFGIYSPIALSLYDIPYPVMNLGLGVERLAMILYGADDVRLLSYPQFGEPTLSDHELAVAVSVGQSPETDAGVAITRAIVRVCEEHGSDPSPCEYQAWEGELFSRQVRVIVVEQEENTKLCGPAAMNEVVIHEGNILGVPRTEKWDHVFAEGIPAGFRFIDAFASQAAREIEDAARCGRGCEVRVKGVKVPSEINIEIAPYANRWITSGNRKIDIRGPVFTAVRMEVVS
ncbi:MAG TPA: O-phosphoserine--tRNA ligase [Methanosarcinales archaeon]|nr:O-phosphoserine--tRNA ligase [Methanosarcinales archaeon]